MVPRVDISARQAMVGLVLSGFALLAILQPSLQLEVRARDGWHEVDTTQAGAGEGIAISSQEVSPAARPGVAMVELPDHTVFAIGGFDTKLGIRDRVDAYDPRSKRWRQVASMPAPRHGHRAVSAADGRIYVAGGYYFDERLHYLDLKPTFQANLLAYDPLTDTWTSVGALATPRFEPEVTAGEDGVVYIRGGFTPSGERPANDEAFDVVNGVWSITAGDVTP